MEGLLIDFGRASRCHGQRRISTTPHSRRAFAAGGLTSWESARVRFTALELIHLAAEALRCHNSGYNAYAKDRQCVSRSTQQ